MTASPTQGTNWGALAQGLAPLAIGAAGYLTAQPNTTTTTASPQFLSAGQQNLFNQGVEGLRQAGAQPYAANNWITNYQQMLGGLATDPTVAQSFGQASETVGGLSNQLSNLSGGANWINDPSRMTADITAAQNPWNNLVRDTTLQYAQQAADRGNTADRAGASAGMSGFGDRSQIALELGRDKRQQGLNSLAAQLNQQGYSAATQQANQNNTQARADIGAQSSLAQLPPQLAQQARAVMLNNAQLLGQEGTAQRDYATTNATNLINAGTKGMGTQTVTSTPANPFMQGLSSGLAAFSPAVQSGVSGLVQNAPSIASGIGNAASSIWDGLSSAGSWIGGLFGFEDGGHVRGYRSGGLARYAEGGAVPEEDVPVAPTEAFAQELVAQVPEQVAQAQAAPPLGPVTLGGAARRMLPTPGGQPPASAAPARPPITVGGTNIEDEFIKRLMAGPDPAEMREARATERRAMEALMEEYKPRKDDWRQNLADIGIGMANSGAQSFGTAFAKGVGHADARANERTNLERQARRELAKIQLDMSREGRKELTEAERTRLTTLAGVLRERGAAEERRERGEADRLSREQIAGGQLAAVREAAAARTDLARDAREARDERALDRQINEWNALLGRQEPVWQRAAEKAAEGVHKDDRAAFIEDFIQQRREEFEKRVPRPGARAPAAPAATAGAPPPGAAPMAAPAPAATAGAPPAVPAPTPAPAPTVAPAPAAAAPATPPPDDRSVAARRGFRPAEPVKLPPAATKIQNDLVEQIGTTTSINADLGRFVQLIDEGKLEFGPLQNRVNRGRNLVGMSNDQSRNLSSFESGLERLRNESLRLNAGVQTDGDAQRAWNELIQNINDPNIVKQRLEEIQRLNERAAALKQNQVDLLRKEHGLPPLDTSAFRTASPAVGGGDKKNTKIEEGSTATNPITGQKIILRNGKWEPVQ